MLLIFLPDKRKKPQIFRSAASKSVWSGRESDRRPRFFNPLLYRLGYPTTHREVELYHKKIKMPIYFHFLHLVRKKNSDGPALSGIVLVELIDSGI